MKIFLYDSLQRRKREFIPLDEKNVRIYACGPTVYNHAHIGNARMSVVTDLLVDVLKTNYSQVKFVSNITDIDDKIIEASRKSKIKIEEITKKYLNIYNEDMSSIGVKRPDIQPKATEYISQMIEMIEKLIENDCAYVSEKHVLFDVKKYIHYGCLSRRSKKEQIAGSRIEIAKYKRNPEDFVLWKPSKNDEPAWSSPWGKGRPGWHIECSVMSSICLGLPFDIHCGGVDLTFPHHENEIAQSCSVTNKNSKPENFSRYWFHNGFVTVNGEKMSKSLGNITLVNELLKNYTGTVIRFCLLSSHYRQPLDWSERNLQQSKKTLNRYKKIFDEFELNEFNESDPIDDSYNLFLNDLYDDLNTPKAMATLNIFFENFKKKKEKKILVLISRCLKLLGINLKNIEKNKIVKDEQKKMIDQLILEREIARKAKNFSKADQIREKLEKMDIIIEDSIGITKWKKK